MIDALYENVQNNFDADLPVDWIKENPNHHSGWLQ